jgi:hypothetical protein
MRTMSTLARSLAFLACGLVTVSCAESPSDTGMEVSDLTVATGVDYSFSHPAPSAIRSAGYTFAARYLSYVPSKNLSAGERDALWGSGVDVVVVWEQAADDALGGYGAGVSDAHAAINEANGLGIPGDRPIYFAVDFDATPGQQGAIDAYFDGVAAVIGRNRTGVYGGYWVVKRLFDDGKISWGWQTYAWSGGNWDGRAQLRQTLNGISVGVWGDCCDRDEAVANDFGQWHSQGVGGDGCTAQEDQNCGVFGCFCVDHNPSGGYCNGTGCTAVETTNAGAFGCACVDHQPSGGFCPGTGCTVRETSDAAQFGCACVDHQGNGGFCPGTGCTAKETNDAAHFGCTCVDHQPNGGYCPGHGCTAKEEHDTAAFACACVDHAASGGYCPGTGCTAKETDDAAHFGCGCVDHQPNGGYCPGSGCTVKETNDAAHFGCGCVDHHPSGGFCPGTGCTAKETNDCTAQGRGCAVHECT